MPRWPILTTATTIVIAVWGIIWAPAASEKLGQPLVRPDLVTAPSVTKEPAGTSLAVYESSPSAPTVSTPAEQQTSVAAAGLRVIRRVIRDIPTGKNLIMIDAARPYGKGFKRDGDQFICESPTAGAQFGVMFSVELNQQRPLPIIAVAESRAEGVGGTPDSGYSLYLDLMYVDGTPLWGQNAPFATGTHDWQKRQVIVFPEKPVRRLSYYLLFRNHAGKVAFRNPRLYTIDVGGGECMFDTVPCVLEAKDFTGFSVRDVRAGTDFVAIEKEALGLRLSTKVSESAGARFIDLTISSNTTEDRAITLVYSRPVPSDGLRWFRDPRTEELVRASQEYMWTTNWRVGNRRLSRYPFAAVGNQTQGWAVGIDMLRPAFFRCGYNAGTKELFVAYDLALTPEKPQAKLRLVEFTFDPKAGFRGALARYYALFPDHFQVRIKRQGLWMPFARISAVKGWEDFGFRFKEGNNETAWDDAHDILTFRYTEPMTWWMPMAPEIPRTYEAALRLAEEQAAAGKPQALAWRTSSFRDAEGKIPVLLLNTPWCNGAVWSMNSMPEIPGEVTDFSLKWNQKIREQLYGPKAPGQLDGEYIDSSEGYVTAELDFRREHFVGDVPLTWDPETYAPAVFRGLIVFEYVRAIAADVHGMGKYMMANGTPGRICWLVPLLDVMGTETDWNPGGRWQPMTDQELLYRRALCAGKPYCFLMNTDFDRFGPDLVRKYMERSLAYGMFPGFFSPNASTGHYFTRPELYERDRPLFRKYVPLCRLVAEAGWQPITAARCSVQEVYVEQFGSRYFTVFNDGPKRQEVTIIWNESVGPVSQVRELLSGQLMTVDKGPPARLTMALDPESVAVLDISTEN
ncbi:MAG: hypothetical protein NZ899_00755 [Thermoguttaceae bacterium]|nr:hypothetical protein [Thermoguttaceae bacterium]